MRLILALAVLSSLLFAGPRAEAVVVERIVAVVGEKAILHSDLRSRARPYLLQLHAQCPLGTPPCIPAENKVLGQLLQRMVDEELERQAAQRVNVVVSSEDVDRTMQRIARLSGVSVSQLYDQVRQQSGLDEQEYRQEIRRQVLEGKLVNRLVQNQVRITKQEVRAMYDRVVAQERRIRLYHAAWIVLRVGQSPDEATLAAGMKQARQIIDLAKGGSDFGQLARQFSDEPDTKESGGDLGVRAPADSPAYKSGKYNKLAKPLEDVAMRLEPDDISEPIRFMQAIVVLKLANRQPSRYTSFEAAQSEMIQRVQGEKLEQAKTKWLQDLRRRTHVDVRL